MKIVRNSFFISFLFLSSLTQGTQEAQGQCLRDKVLVSALKVFSSFQSLCQSVSLESCEEEVFDHKTPLRKMKNFLERQHMDIGPNLRVRGMVINDILPLIEIYSREKRYAEMYGVPANMIGLALSSAMVSENYFNFVIEDLNTHKPVGFVNLRNLKEKKPILSSFISPDYEGQGIMSTASRSVFQLFFRKTPFEAIYSRVKKTNVRNIRLKEKLGFIQHPDSDSERGSSQHIHFILSKQQINSQEEQN